MVTFGILCISVAFFLIIAAAADDNLCKTISTILATVLLAFAGVLLIKKEYIIDSPTALDVYRGNTNLQINVKRINGKVVPTDSIVVWKN